MAFQHPTSNPVKNRFEGFESIKIASYKANVKDAFNLNYLYLMMHDWLVDEGWGSRDNDFDFGETNYVQRDNPNFGKEIWLYWRIKKEKPLGNPFFSFLMDVDFHILGLKNTEIAWKGQKVETNKGEFEADVNAYILYDPGKQWTSWPWKDIKNVMMKRSYRAALNMHKKAIYTDAYRFRDLIMNYLKMETFMPVAEAGEFYLKRTLE